MRAFRVLAMVAAIAAGARIAHADPAAEALFREGRELMTARDFAAACDRFARSQELEPKVGTLLNLGDCREQQGQLAEAWAVFSEARALATVQKDERAVEADRRASALAPRLAWLTIDVSGELAPGLVIMRNGAPVPPAAWGTSVPVDPGAHMLVATAPGYKPQSQRIELAIGERGAATVPALAVDPDAQRPELPIGDRPPGEPAAIRPPLGRVGFGLAFGGTSDEDIVGGIRIVGSYPVPRGAIRATIQTLYTRYHPDEDPYHNVNLYGNTLGFDYLLAWGNGLASAGGIGVGLDVYDDNYANGLYTDTWLGVRLSPLVVRLRSPRLELGIHLFYVIDNEILVGVLGADWFVW